MAIEDAILEELRRLPPAKQEEVLHFVEDLEEEAAPPRRRSAEGLFAHLGIDITSEDIAEARREMWGNFPRDDV